MFPSVAVTKSSIARMIKYPIHVGIYLTVYVEAYCQSITFFLYATSSSVHGHTDTHILHSSPQHKKCARRTHHLKIVVLILIFFFVKHHLDLNNVSLVAP